MRTETVRIDDRFGAEYAGRYIFSEISWARRSRIIQKHTRYHPVTGQVVGSDYVAVQAETIAASLKEQPSHKPITLERLLKENEDGIPVELGELFSRIVNRLCSLTADEAKNSSGQCGEGNLIQASQSLDSARNSAGHPDNYKDNPPKHSKNSSPS